MKDNLLASASAANSLGITYVRQDDFDSEPTQLRRRPAGHGAHPIATRHKLLDQVTSKKPGGSSDECLHDLLP